MQSSDIINRRYIIESYNDKLLRQGVFYEEMKQQNMQQLKYIYFLAFN